MSTFTSFLERLATKIITWAGTPLPRQQTLDFWGAGVEEVTDDPVNGRTRVKISAGAGATAHSALTGLTTGNDHTQYPLRTGSTLSGTFTWTGGNVDVQAGIAQSLNLRRGTGDPNGSITAARGTIWQRTDGTGQHYVNTDDGTTWVQLAAGGLALTSTAPLAVGGATSLGSSSDAMKGDAKPDIGVKGASIASAATINLDTATGDYVHITGTEPIGAITLAQGLSRTTIFDDACLLTHSASLLLNNGGANITTEAGGWMFCRGEGAGVTRGMYFRADGSSLQLANTTETITGTSFSKAVTPDSLAALWEQGTDNTDGATITLGEGGVFNLNTSTTTITAFVFTTSKAGRIAWVKFNTVRILTHNATSLILQGGANITTAVGDYGMVIDLGSGNVQLLYFRAVGDTNPTATLAFQDDPEGYGELLTATFGVSHLPDNCTVAARVVAAWGVTDGDTADKDGAAWTYVRLFKNGGALTKATTLNGPSGVSQIHAASDHAVMTSQNLLTEPSSSGIITAEVDGGDLKVTFQLPGTGVYSGPTISGSATLYTEAIFSRPLLAAP